MAYVGQNTKRKARAAVRRKEALALRVQGLTYEEIGAKLGITKQSVSVLMKKELAEVARERRELAEYQIDTELEAVNFALAGLAPKVKKGDPMAAQAFFRGLERRAKLLGLDAPEKHHHTHDVRKLSDAELDAEINRLSGGAGAPAPSPEGAGAAADRTGADER